MTLTVNLLFVCLGLAVLADCRPQDVFGFPGQSEGSIPDQTNRLTTRRPSQNMIPQQTQPTSQSPDGAETTTRVSRVPPRDPTNRIVFIVSCPCQFTRQYNPVCGTDGQTYGNMGVLRCAQTCGTDVNIFLVGACGSNNG